MSSPNSLPADKRGHQRSPLARGAKFLLEQQSHDCALNNISVGGAALISTLKPEPDTPITLMIEEIEPLPARVTRTLVDGFAVEFDIPAEDQDRVAGILLYLSDMRQFL